jgi:hypothetical protein
VCSSKNNKWILFEKHFYINSVVLWLLWPSNMSRRGSFGLYSAVWGIKTVCNYSKAVLLDVYLLLVIVNFQPLYSLNPIENHCCWTNFPLNIIIRKMAQPLKEIYLINKV